MPSRFRRFQHVLTDYCLNSSISGLAYVADARYHYTERLFWLGCLLFSMAGSYHFIMDTMESFEADTISMVVESLQPNDRTAFPSIAVCEMGNIKDEYPFLDEFTDNYTASSTDEDNNGDVYDFLMRIIFFNLYTTNTFQAYCSKYEEAADDDSPDSHVVRCPPDDYIEFSRRASVSCAAFISDCTWMSRPFDCCQYFRPLRTTYGPCFVLNNIQATARGGEHWLDTHMDRSTGPGELRLAVSRSARVCVQNEEQVPNLLFSRLHFELRNQDTEMQIALQLQAVTNGVGVRESVEPARRMCKFPEEAPQSGYPYYSFVTCIAECIKQAQVRACGCAHHYMTLDGDNGIRDATPRCNYSGLVCLDVAELIYPQASVLQPWNGFFGDRCECWPSCTDNEIQVASSWTGNADGRRLVVRVVDLPTQRYVRTRNKDQVDFVVAVGGIVSLFLGASILSVLELVYWFTVRLVGTAWMARGGRRMARKGEERLVERMW